MHENSDVVNPFPAALLLPGDAFDTDKLQDVKYLTQKIAVLRIFNDNNNNIGEISFEESKPMSYEEIQKAKFDLLCKFERLRDNKAKHTQINNLQTRLRNIKRYNN